MKVTIKLSGHILFPDLISMPDLKPYVNAIEQLKRRGHEVFVVVGGGEPARHYIKIARENGADESTCDQIGIMMAYLNAKIFSKALGDLACPFIPKDFDELEKALATGKIVLMGGLQPGQSTNAVAAVLAERSASELFVNTTTVDGVYSSDPRKNPEAKKYKKVTISELEKILNTMGAKAGEYDLLDSVAIKIIQRSKITTKIIDGRDPMNVLKAVEGKDVGTIVVP